MFRKILSIIGIGGAKVNTSLGADSFFPGEMVSGEVHITGGGDAQELNRIYICVVTSYKHDDSTHEYTLASQDVTGNLRIEASENRSIPSTFNLPGARHSRSATRASTSRPGSTSPTPSTRATGTRYTSPSSGERVQPSKGYPHPFVQQLGFRPSGGRYAGRVEELELIFKPRQPGLDEDVDLDRRASSLGGFLESAMEFNERFDRLQVTLMKARTNAVEGMLVWGNRDSRSLASTVFRAQLKFSDNNRMEPNTLLPLPHFLRALTHYLPRGLYTAGRLSICPVTKI